jgi:FkbH-like protein
LSTELYRDVAWLPPVPGDFRQQCRKLATPGAFDVRALRRLAGYALDESKLRILAGVLEAARAAGNSLAPLSPFRLGVVSNGNVEPIVPALVATAVRYGIALECCAAGFGQTVQEAMSPQSTINAARPDAVLLALDYRVLPLSPAPADGERARAAVAEALALIATLRDGFRTHAHAISLVQTLAPPVESMFGSFDRRLEGSMRSVVAAFNAAVADSLSASNDVLFDVASLAETVGLADWHSPKQWHLAKLPFDAKLVPLYAEHVCRIIAALLGKARRCLVLDLDNTIWGGAIGDDGLEGIVIGQGDATGEAYLEMQRSALELRSRGIVLAVSSKNEDAIARSAFASHPEMLLQEDHIAVFQANWGDKAANIAAIAAELSLGLDAMVFVDDNPAERMFVRETLPEVAVPELPDDPALYARTLAAAGYFEALAFTEEDRRRPEFYRSNTRRAAFELQARDLTEFLASLDMEISFRPFDAMGRSRIAQLINKSNQFNLTTRRYTEQEIAALELDPHAFTLQVRLRDRFGDNGMIGIVICRERSPEEWDIDTWLMSCRVLGRGVERMVLREILHHARAGGVRRVIGRYVPTQRNELVREHYPTLGFTFADSDGLGATTWIIQTDADIEAAPMALDRSAFERGTAERA